MIWKSTYASNLYVWLNMYKSGGRPVLMSQADENRQRAATRQQLEASLHDNPDELRATAAQLAVDKALLKEELELLEK
ncbi:MAG: hypothetical protein ACTHUY_00310 [Flaviflexus sp.]|uniref:hypothetical protein n=2 Tax=Flaviflexus sp. TaxID=1969482 RepID=UPI003F9305C0